MKQPKRLTRKHKQALSADGLNHHDYMYISETEFFYQFQHKTKKTIKSVDKFWDRRISRNAHKLATKKAENKEK